MAKYAAEVWRLVEVEAKTQSRLLTDSEEEYDFLEVYIDGGKPPFPATGHHYLIATPFRYVVPTPPQYAARFKPPEEDPKAFFAAVDRETTFYESAYHWLRERLHLTGLSQTPESRTLFSVAFSGTEVWDVSNEPNLAALTDRHSYEASWSFVRKHPELRSVLFPSCRAPSRGLNLMTTDITTLAKQPTGGSLAHFQLVYQAATKTCLVQHKVQLEPQRLIAWADVS